MDTKLVKLTLADTALTFLWVVCTSCLGVWSAVIARSLDWQGDRTPIVIAIVVVLIFAFSISAKALGGATWNPTGPVAFYAVGASKDSLFTLAIRLPATEGGSFLINVEKSSKQLQSDNASADQAVGGALGALTIAELMPIAYKHTLGGPRLKVGLHTGAFAEGILTFAITIVVLLTVLNGPRNGLVKTSIITVATLTCVTIGAPYTGPAMNPANAFAWAYMNNKQYSNEHLYVYWITPFIGALTASALYRLLFKALSPPPPKEEKTEKTE